MQILGGRFEIKKMFQVRLVILLVTFFMVGCETIATSILKEPEVSVAGFRVISANLMNQRFGVKIKIDNPNFISMPINKIKYTFDVAGREFVNGSTDKPIRVPAKGNETFEVEVNMNILESASYLATIFESGSESLDYKLKGSIDVDLPLLGIIPIIKKGQIKLTH